MKRKLTKLQLARAVVATALGLVAAAFAMAAIAAQWRVAEVDDEEKRDGGPSP